MHTTCAFHLGCIQVVVVVSQHIIHVMTGGSNPFLWLHSGNGGGDGDDGVVVVQCHVLYYDNKINERI
jgi:hypothetical protein